MTTERRAGQFTAVSDNGQRYSINVYQQFEVVHELGKRSPTNIPTLQRFELDDGSPVNMIDDTTFEIVMTGEKVRKAG